MADEEAYIADIEYDERGCWDAYVHTAFSARTVWAGNANHLGNAVERLLEWAGER